MSSVFSLFKNSKIIKANCILHKNFHPFSSLLQSRVSKCTYVSDSVKKYQERLVSQEPRELTVEEEQFVLKNQMLKEIGDDTNILQPTGKTNKQLYNEDPTIGHGSRKNYQKYIFPPALIWYLWVIWTFGMYERHRLKDLDSLNNRKARREELKAERLERERLETT